MSWIASRDVAEIDIAADLRAGTDGKIYLEGSDATVQFCILQKIR